MNQGQIGQPYYGHQPSLHVAPAPANHGQSIQVGGGASSPNAKVRRGVPNSDCHLLNPNETLLVRRSTYGFPATLIHPDLNFQIDYVANNGGHGQRRERKKHRHPESSTSSNMVSQPIGSGGSSSSNASSYQQPHYGHPRHPAPVNVGPEMMHQSEVTIATHSMRMGYSSSSSEYHHSREGHLVQQYDGGESLVDGRPYYPTGHPTDDVGFGGRGFHLPNQTFPSSLNSSNVVKLQQLHQQQQRASSKAAAQPQHPGYRKSGSRSSEASSAYSGSDTMQVIRTKRRLAPEFLKIRFLKIHSAPLKRKKSRRLVSSEPPAWGERPCK